MGMSICSVVLRASKGRRHEGTFGWRVVTWALKGSFGGGGGGWGEGRMGLMVLGFYGRDR